MRTYRNYGRALSPDFGKWLRQLRKGTGQTLDEAAEGLGLEGKARVSYLSQIERGKKPVPWKVLVNISSFYPEVSDEEVLQRAYSPQLHLPMLNSILKGQALSNSIDKFLEQMEIEFKDYEKKKLTEYAQLLILGRGHI